MSIRVSLNFVMIKGPSANGVVIRTGYCDFCLKMRYLPGPDNYFFAGCQAGKGIVPQSPAAGGGEANMLGITQSFAMIRQAGLWKSPNISGKFGSRHY
jgi:hypothetical protein